MPSYLRTTVAEFLSLDADQTLGRLNAAYSQDGYASLYTKQMIAWRNFIPMFQRELQELQNVTRELAGNWPVLLEFPLYRLRKRIDAVVLAGTKIVVIETKVGEKQFRKADERQVEEYCLDLRDFHKGSQKYKLIPILWCTEAKDTVVSPINGGPVSAVQHIGRHGLGKNLAKLTCDGLQELLDGAKWDEAPYRPVPTIIEAATAVFASHDAPDIAHHDASNLDETVARIIEIIVEARSRNQKVLIFVTGVPGAGKTLAGLKVVHHAIATGEEQQGDIVYLSGNTPLVTVLREALAQDEYARKNDRTASLEDIRRDVRTRIQHINDFVKTYGDSAEPPHEHAIVFDEAQRAWDEFFGQRKFNRAESEPALILRMMSRHTDWAACICLIGGGQEINNGEQGIAGWGRGLMSLDDTSSRQWTVYAPPDAIECEASAGHLVLGLDSGLVRVDDSLQLRVPIRSYRSPGISTWVERVLDGNSGQARTIATGLSNYPIMLTRSLATARQWLKNTARGQRRCGLVAARRRCDSARTA